MAFKNAYDSLNIGGRILIRDGVLNQKMINPTIEIKDTETLNLAKAYVNQFQGLPTERVHHTPLFEFTGGKSNRWFHQCHSGIAIYCYMGK